MPPLPDAPSCVRVAIAGSYGSAAFQNIMHMRYTGSPPDANGCASVATQVGNAWNSNLAPLHSTSITMSSVTVTDINSAIGATGVSGVSHPGTRAGSALTAQVACVVSWHVQMRWRGGHPRTYLPIGVLADITGNHLWLATSVTAFVAGVQGFFTAMNAIAVGGSGYSMVLVRYQGIQPPNTIPLVLPITSFNIHGRVDTQRRRLGREVP